MGVAVGLQCSVLEGPPEGATDYLLDLVKRRLQIDFRDHDELLRDLIDQGLGELETFMGISYLPQTRKVTYQSFGERRDPASVQIPYGPVVEVTDKTDGLTIVNGVATGEFPSGISITYKAGHETLPTDLQGILVTWVREQFETATGTERGTQTPTGEWKSQARRKRQFTAFS